MQLAALTVFRSKDDAKGARSTVKARPHSMLGYAEHGKCMARSDNARLDAHVHPRTVVAHGRGPAQAAGAARDFAYFPNSTTP